MSRQETYCPPTSIDSPTTLFLCINGDEESLQRALEGARSRGREGIVLSLPRRIAERKRPSISRVAIRWKRRSKIIGYLYASVAEIVDAGSARGSRLLEDADPDARPWPSLRAKRCGCVLRLTDLSRIESEAAWAGLPSPQSWTYLTSTVI